MIVRIHGLQHLHRVLRSDRYDERIAHTRCGIAFGWGRLRGPFGSLPKCEECFA